MKKLWAVLLALALVAMLTACGHFVNIMPGTEAIMPGATSPPLEAEEDNFRDQPLFEFIRWTEFSTSYYRNTPVALSYRNSATGDYASPVFDRASIIAACDALRAMTVTGRASFEPTGEEITLTFTMADGHENTLLFQDGCLMLNSGAYTVEGGDELWAIAFPGYSGDFDLFDLYFSASARTFADSFQTDTPVSVGRRFNGGATLTSKDPEIVSQVFQILSQATVNRIEENPDQNIDLTQTTDYVFTMADASTCTFSFTGPCLAVTVSDVYGTVYYWLDGTDALPAVNVLPESTLPTFEGGALYELREDIAQAADAANGFYSDLSVLGVYVDYNLDGNQAYLTLSGDTAVNFVRQVTAIHASSELADATGDTITVFITLSDQSGPILVFNGDTVQQLVGMNYTCDYAAMENLRNTIRTLALDETNIGYIAGGGTG